jgi:ABC-type sugar transport system permease subunit
MGTSSAVAVLLLLVTLVGTLAQMRAARRSSEA